MLTWREIIEAEDVGHFRPFGGMDPKIPVTLRGRALILDLPNEDFRVLSSGFTNGGFMDSPEAVMNVTGMGGSPEYSCMMGGLDEHDESMFAYVRKLGYNPQKTVCMSTAANMENAVITNSESPEGVKISTAITGGIRHNGGRAGDPADFDEATAAYDYEEGTIVILVSIDANLSDAAMLQVMLMVTEAKSCVVQELQARSLYSYEIATGSGTDQVAVISNKGSPNFIDSIDRCSPLAKKLADNVKLGLRRALYRQSGMDARLQGDVMTIFSRYGLTRDTIREEIRFPATMAELEKALAEIRANPYFAALISGLLMLQDMTRHGIVPQDIGLKAARSTCEYIVDGVRNDVERLRMDSAENIPDLLSYTAALRLLRTVQEWREENEK